MTSIVLPHFQRFDASFDSVSLLADFYGANAGTTVYDKSKARRTLTLNGNAQTSTAQKKFGDSSLLLDGNGDYVSMPGSSGFTFGTGDFTIEGWIRRSTSQAYQTVFDFRTGFAPSADGFSFYWDNASNLFAAYSNATLFSCNAGAGSSTGTWYALQVRRSGSTLKAFLDGAEIASVSNSSNFNGSSFRVGSSGTDSWNGHMAWFRVTKGVARSTAAPTQPWPES